MKRYDFCVIGAGIVGLATALRLLDSRPGASLLVLEKEASVGQHQTSHNSGVIHAGIYYEPGSLKARLCRAGLRATIDFCSQHGIPFQQCGKLIVATNAKELDRIETLYSRANANGVELERLDQKALRTIEPSVSGIAALLSRETGMVDYALVCEKMGELITARGADIRFGALVDYIVEGTGGVIIGAGEERWEVARLVVCGGLQSDRLARIAGIDIDFKIVPFRGEYFRLPASKNSIVRHHIYPAPNPELPFLGIHLTRLIDGGVTVGPNAVIGLSREGYSRLSTNIRDLASFLSFPGFWRLVAANVDHALHELQSSLFVTNYLDECRKYCRELALSDLLPHRAGIRAQVVDSRGKAVHDFLFRQTDRMLHVCNAPSPAATSALPIADMIVSRLFRQS